ncbi:two-component regulator propeller domain-containing protein [Flavivirga amylovorans]|uniref:histidine kinase n=1 Tax=Flavivirga amylovorans TaxID=870486 RepID=A0ABT8WY72_9FLAO|nr:two-component regulator propeller domain-containing protein [Flavivirga amylovorans]MDO5986577.1 two-component regulator propeller domain-containing protein [Flavivirga amylovorans]
MSHNFFLLLFFSFGFCCLTNAQYIEDQSSSDFFNLTTENGLSQNTVNTILKDKSGYLWFGTDDGLNRYNSYDIEVIDINQNKSKILSGKKVYDLYEDKNSLLWIGTDNGLKLYNPISKKVTQCDLFKNFNNPIRVYCIEKENDSLSWLGTSEGLVLYSLKLGVVDNYRHSINTPNSLSDSEILSLANDSIGLWIGTQNGLNQLNKKSKQITRYFHDENDKNSVAGNTIKSLSINNTGDLWVGTVQGGLSYLKKGDIHFKTYNTENSNLPHNDVFDIFQTKEGNLWIATNGGGLSKMDKSSHTLTTINRNPDHIQSLVTNSLYSVYEDREGILWVGTYAGGVCFNTSKNSVFKLIRHQAHDKNSIIESRIRSVLHDNKNNLWFGTWGGISVFNPKNKLYTSYCHEADNPSSLSFNTVTSIFEDSKGNMWFGTYTGGINLLAPNKKSFFHYKHNSNDINSISNNNIYCFAEDNNKKLWIGTQTGLNLYNPDQNNFKKYSNINVRDIKVTKNNNLVLATVGGISIFNTTTETFKDFYSNKLESFPISQVYIENNEELVWFCSQGSGMGYLDLNNQEFTFFTEDDGLPSNFVSSMISLGDDVFWVSTFEGLVKFDKQTQTFENFSNTYKLPSKQFQPKASVILPNNYIGFGGSKGLVIFHPDSISKSKKSPEIVFSSLKIDNKNVNVNTPNSPLSESITSIKQINLKANQKDFSIDFAALDFNNQGGNKYAYILENYMSEWVNIGTTRSIGFTNLNHGDYIFKVKAININNNANGNIKSVKISIAPPFYFTWWFKAFIFISLIVVLYYYNKYTIISTKQKNENELQRLKLKSEEDFNQMRFRFFTYISHELRTPLTLISDPVSQLIKNTKDTKGKDLHFLQLIDKNVFRLLRLADQILDISKLDGDTLSLQVSKQNIIKCIEDTANAFHEFAIQNEITFKFHYQNEELIGWVDEDKIEKILYNLLSNAFKFTVKKGHIEILLNYADEESKDYITISVKDDGIGIPKNKLSKIFEGFYQVESAKSLNPNGAGIGLDYVNRLVKLHHGKISVDSELDMGSTFSFTIPIKKELYEPKNIRNHPPERAPLKPINLVKEDTHAEIITKNNNRNTPKVLVVEDDFDIRAYIVEALSVKFKVIEAPNGKEGLVKALKHFPDLILSDTLMPIMDGIEFCKHIKANEKTNHIPFLFLSAWSSDEFKIKGLSIGAIDYIQKPFSIQILESRITNIIETNKKISEKSKKKVNFIPEDKNIDSTDDLFIKKAYEVLDKNFDDSSFNASKFKEEMNMSHSGLYRKLTQLTGQSSNEFIRDYRLKRATQIIKQNSGLLIAEVCIKTGFNDPKYFSKCFKQVYDMTPSEFTKKYAANDYVTDDPQ